MKLTEFVSSTMLAFALTLSACGGESPENQKVIDAVAAPANAEALKLAEGMWKKELTNKNFFPMVRDAAVSRDDAGRCVSIAIMTDAGMKPEQALVLADSAIRRFGSLVGTALNIEGPSREKFGRIFDVYDILISVYPQGCADPGKNGFVSGAVARGVHARVPLKLNERYRK